MLYDEQLLERIASLGVRSWDDNVFRHMWAELQPDRENTVGARWNPPEVPAIYTAESRDVALAEAEYQIGMQPIRPKAKRTIYTIRARINGVVDISSRDIWTSLGIREEDLTDVEQRVCRLVGGAAHHVGCAALIVPSARARGRNLVIYPNRAAETGGYSFEVLSAEIIDSGQTW